MSPAIIIPARASFFRPTRAAAVPIEVPEAKTMLGDTAFRPLTTSEQVRVHCSTAQSGM